MLTAGVPISTALEAQHQSTKNEVYKSVLGKITDGVKKGKAINHVLANTNSSYFPLIASRMISVGEGTGKLDETCVYLALYFEEEVDTTSKNLSAVLEPVILILVGLVVAFVALAIIGPIYQFTGAVKR
jgi:type IV pilus assembly protein PilC